jgi:hypothetical protein
MAVTTEHPERVSFPRPLPRPALFAWATWVAVCGLAFWTYLQTAGPRASVGLAAGFGALVLVVIPVVLRRAREGSAGVAAATLALLGYTLLMQDALR